MSKTIADLRYYEPQELAREYYSRILSAQKSVLLVGSDLYPLGLDFDFARYFWLQLEDKVCRLKGFSVDVITGNLIFKQSWIIPELLKRAQRDFDKYELLNLLILKGGQPKVHGLVIDDERVLIEAPHLKSDQNRYLASFQGEEIAGAFQYTTFVKPITENKTIHLVSGERLYFAESLAELDKSLSFFREHNSKTIKYPSLPEEANEWFVQETQRMKEEYQQARSAVPS